MDENKALIAFQGKNIRRIWFNDEWWFVAADIISALTDSTNPSGYLKDMRRRDEGFAQGWVQIATPLPIDTSGWQQKMSSAMKSWQKDGYNLYIPCWFGAVVSTGFAS
ncbi:hypothetical protein HYU18_03920 [Candidatus Woesearchaeota archaeon]|nr:hypothetical protein [Candidatus Woesearchaeota archaeon]